MNLDGTPDEEDIAFYATYGEWQPLTVTELSDLMRGFPHPWWLVGGHAIDAFTGVPRPHADIDVSFFSHSTPDFRKHLGGRYHLWSNYGGTFRLLDDKHPEPLHPLAQIWARENAQSPWVLDGVPNPSVAGRWQSKRDDEHVADLDQVTWVDDHQMRFLNPEVVLLFKAAQNREMDRFDLDNVWPLLTGEERQWLRDAVRRFDREHPWNERLASPAVNVQRGN